MNPEVWVPLAVAGIGVVPGTLAYLASRATRKQVTTNHGKRLGEHVELIAEKVHLVEQRQEIQHLKLSEQMDALAQEVTRQRQAIEARSKAAEAVLKSIGKSPARERV